MRLKPSAYLILGMVRGGFETGYEIKRMVDQSTRHFWAASLAQVYPELARLEQNGYLTARDEPRGDRPRRAYALTEQGEEAFRQWLTGPQTPRFEFRDEGLLRLFFADCLETAEAIELVRRLRRDAEAIDQAFRAEILPIATAAREQMPFPLIAAEMGAEYYAWRASFFARLEERLTESGRASRRRS